MGQFCPRTNLVSGSVLDARQQLTKDTNHGRNIEDLVRFLHRLGGKSIEGFMDGELYGPFVLPGALGVELYVGKVSRNLRLGST